tara:strand:+ start:463 stop:774 length:312 start_codon:yes stop_codon:yes gene_type:complete
MSSIVTSVFTFKVSSTFSEWATIFDSKEAIKRHREFSIQPLYRGCNRDNPQEVIVVHQHPEGNIEKFIEANGEWMASHRVDLSTMKQTAWTWSDSSIDELKAA